MRLGLGVQENFEEEDEHQDGYKEDKCQVLLSILLFWLLFVGSTDSVLGRFNKGCCVGVLLDCTKNLRAQTLNLFHFFLLSEVCSRGYSAFTLFWHTVRNVK